MLLTANKPAVTKERSFEDTIALLDRDYSSTNDSGVFVNTQRAMQQSTVYACVRIISEIIAQLPLEVQTKRTGKWVTAEDHDLLELLANPNDWQTQHDFIATIVSWAELEGNAYQFKQKSGDGRTKMVIPLNASEVETEMHPTKREVEYTVADSEMRIIGTFKADKIFHMRNFGIAGYKGLSTITAHRNGIGLALQLEKHANKAYKNGMQSNKWVKLETSLQGEALTSFKDNLRKYQGAMNAGELPALSGAEIKEFNGISAVDAQYIESRRMQKEEIATMFLVPVFLLNSTDNTTWGSGIEQITRSFVRFSLNPRLNRLAQTLVREFIPEKARHKTRVTFDTDQFTLGDFKERMDGYRAAIESGVLSPNEAREMESRNPRDGGEDYRIPVNITTEDNLDAIQNTQQPAGN